MVKSSQNSPVLVLIFWGSSPGVLCLFMDNFTGKVAFFLASESYIELDALRFTHL